MNKATEVSVNLEYGFAHAHDGDENNNFFQVCLQQRKDKKGYKKSIKSDDSGWDWGLCGDYNDSVGATEKDYKAFLNLARKCGIKVV
jgi:hypothetical protein